MLEVINETLVDSFKLLPFLFITFLIIELFEHKLNDKSKKVISKSKKLGPLFGSILGIIPQCGFSVAATNLYVTRIVTLGTLIAVYLSTSDEMLPILIASGAKISIILKILVVKLIVGLICGFLIDLFIKQKENQNYSICSKESCHCKKSLLVASVKHTINIFVFIFICDFIINLIMEFGGYEVLEKILLKDSIFAPVITSLVGLIPNCASSVILTELFLNNAINFGSLIAGLLSGAGIAILVLFKINKNEKENFSIVIGMYVLGVIFGIAIELITKIL